LYISAAVQNGGKRLNMSVEVKPFENLQKLMAELEARALSNRDFVFRGHRDESWRINTTYARHTSTPHRSWDTYIDDMLSHFIVNALSIGSIPFPKTDRRSRLEYGRHYGVPTPLIDFSWSPYVALFFAFNGVHFRHDASPSNGALYALNVSLLAQGWAQLVGAPSAYDEFRWEKANMFEHGYPEGELKFMTFPASWNQRMQRQLGCFVYDTLDHRQSHLGPDFEGFVESIKEATSSDGKRHPTLTKFIVPHSEAKNVFSRLELMNITATKLIDYEGLAADVQNAYNYNRKTGYAWDAVLPPPDDTKM
jgi:hypothetical protein